jgi:hypothetical protein
VRVCLPRGMSYDVDLSGSTRRLRRYSRDVAQAGKLMEQSLVSRSNATERAKSAVSAYLLCLVAGLAGCQHQAKPADQASASREQPRNGGAAVPEDVGAPSERKFRFFYAATINELPPEAAARIWLPLPPTNHEQTIKIENIQAPGKVQRTTESRFGNNLLYLEAQADVRGEIPLEVTYLVTRRGVSLEGAPAGGTSREQFLTGSSLVPANGKVLKRFFSDEPPRGTTLDVARALYDRVELHMKYDKSGEGWGAATRFGPVTRSAATALIFTACLLHSAATCTSPPGSKSAFCCPAIANEGRSPATTAGRNFWIASAGLASTSQQPINTRSEKIFSSATCRPTA